ncbi:ATP-binding protein [Streptomyces sp. NPDC059783]|uniref:ATP-binding protein n=1 Tax=Streptomyces sp. NPDC059783 TaxID=3346944 RepID=UPI00364632E3
MDDAGAYESPASVPPRPVRPPIPGQPSAPPRPDGAAFLAWLRAPRAGDAPVGIWRQGHRARPATEPEAVPGRQLLVGAGLAGLIAWCVWSLLYNGYIGLWWLLPLELLTPDSWRYGEAGETVTVLVYYGYYALIAGGLLTAAGKLGRWPEVWRRYVLPRVRPADPPPPPPVPEEDPARWPHVRRESPQAADRLSADAAAGLMRDVDYARIERAWQSVRARRHSLGAFEAAVLRDGAAAFGHPSGDRDLPARVARHDLLTGQTRLGTVADTAKNPYAYRQTGAALDLAVLGSSLLVVGPAGSGKTRRVTRPVAESLCLHALAGRAAVVVVSAPGADLGTGYDVVVRLGHPDSAHDLDLYGGTTDPDQAAAVLAEALAGDLPEDGPGRAAALLARLLAPHRAAYGRFPSVPALRQLLDAPEAVQALRQALEAAGEHGMVRDLDTARRALAPGGLGETLADRLAALDRPAFATFFDPAGEGRAFSLRSLDHPVRVRIELPDRQHAEAARILARLILAQFNAVAAARADQSLFACLVLDAAAGVMTPDAVQGLQGLRSANAGLVLALRGLADVPDPLRAPLLGTMGCRVALAGITAWDGRYLADAWGTEWIETQDVTDRQIIAETTGGRAWHAVRRAITGKYVTARAVTVRQVERQRWSASELAHIEPGHAVMSVSSVDGDRTSPMLVDLRK